MQPSVNVLMSSYNGEKYIKEQIESILAQKDVKLVLTVRDDCSTDSTLEILEELSNYDSRIRIYAGNNNLGYSNSFMWLINNCSNEEEFYAISDQDDVWLEEKLSRTIQLLGYKNKPMLGFCNADVVDKDLKYIKKRYPDNWASHKKWLSIEESKASGHLMVFNRALLDEVRRIKCELPITYDKLLYTICAYTGCVFFLNETLCKHRIHGNNASVSTKSKRIKSQINTALRGRSRYIPVCKALLDLYEDKISEEDKAFLNSMKQYKWNLPVIMKTIISRKLSTGVFSHDIRIYLKLLMGRL